MRIGSLHAGPRNSRSSTAPIGTFLASTTCESFSMTWRMRLIVRRDSNRQINILRLDARVPAVSQSAIANRRAGDMFFFLKQPLAKYKFQSPAPVRHDLIRAEACSDGPKVTVWNDCAK